jgi:hypothetical protein
MIYKGICKNKKCKLQKDQENRNKDKENDKEKVADKKKE